MNGHTMDTIESEDLKAMSRLAKTAYKAWQAYPYGMQNLGVSGEWLYGPTFIVKMPTEDQVASVFLAKHTESVYRSDQTVYEEAANSWIKDEYKESGIHIKEIANTGHAKAQEETKDKHGAMVLKGGQKCTGRYIGFDMELSYPLYMLLKAAGAKNYKLVKDSKTKRGLYGYTSTGELVALVAPQDCSKQCLQGLESA